MSKVNRYERSPVLTMRSRLSIPLYCNRLKGSHLEQLRYGADTPELVFGLIVVVEQGHDRQTKRCSENADETEHTPARDRHRGSRLILLLGGSSTLVLLCNLGGRGVGLHRTT